MNDRINELAEILRDTRSCAVLTGAGISTGSGIPDFRGAGGLYAGENGISCEELLSIRFFKAHPERFWDFLRSRMLYPGARPNAAHLLLARLEREGRVGTLITQNIDRLHTFAGSRNVIEVHGDLWNFTCVSCGRKQELRSVLGGEGVARCPECGGILRPDIVFYGEQLDPDRLDRAFAAVSASPLLVVIGSSLVVEPVASLAGCVRSGGRLVIVNADPTPYDARAELVIREDIVSVARELERLL